MSPGGDGVEVFDFHESMEGLPSSVAGAVSSFVFPLISSKIPAQQRVRKERRGREAPHVHVF